MNTQGQQAVERAIVKHIDAAVAQGWARDTATTAIRSRAAEVRTSLMSAAVARAEQGLHELLKKQGATPSQRAQLLRSKRATLEAKFERVFGLSSSTMEGWPGFAELSRLAARQSNWKVSASSLDLYKWRVGGQLLLRLELDSSHDILWARIARDGVLAPVSDSIAVADRHTWERRCPREWMYLLEIAALDSGSPYQGDWQAILRELAVFSGIETEVGAPAALGGMRFNFLHAYLAAHMPSTLNDKDKDRPTLLGRIEYAWNRLPIPGLGDLHHSREQREGPISELLASTWDVYLNAIPHRELERDGIVQESELRVASVGSRLFYFVLLLQDGYVYRYFVKNHHGEDYWQRSDHEGPVSSASEQTWSRYSGPRPPRGLAGYIIDKDVDELTLSIGTDIIRHLSRTYREAPFVIEEIRATLLAAYADLQATSCVGPPYEQTLDALLVAARLYEQTSRHAELGPIPSAERERLDPVITAVRLLASTCASGQVNVTPINQLTRSLREIAGVDEVYPQPSAREPEALYGTARVDSRAMEWTHELLTMEMEPENAVRLSEDALVFTLESNQMLSKSRAIIRVPVTTKDTVAGETHPIPPLIRGYKHNRTRSAQEIKLSESGLTMPGQWRDVAQGVTREPVIRRWPNLLVEEESYLVVHDHMRIGPFFRALRSQFLSALLTTSPTLGPYFAAGNVKLAPRFAVPSGDIKIGQTQLEALVTTRSLVQWTHGVIGRGEERAKWSVFSGQDLGVRWWLGVEASTHYPPDTQPSTWSGEDVEGLTFTIDVNVLYDAVTALHTNALTLDVSSDRVMLIPDDEEIDPVELFSARIHESAQLVPQASITLISANITALLHNVFHFGETVDVRVVPRMLINHLVAEDDPGERPALIMYQEGDADAPAQHIQAALAEIIIR